MAATKSSVRNQARIFLPTGLGRGHGPLLRFPPRFMTPGCAVAHDRQIQKNSMCKRRMPTVALGSMPPGWVMYWISGCRVRWGLSLAA